MALIKCPECQNSISDKAEKCPHCGLPAEYFNVAGAPVEKVDGGIDYKSIANIIISFDKDCPICGFPLKYEFNKNYGLQLWICTNDSEVCDFMTNDKVHKHDIFKCPQCADGYMIVKMNPKNGNVFYGCTNYFSDTNKCTNMISLGNDSQPKK